VQGADEGQRVDEKGALVKVCCGMIVHFLWRVDRGLGDLVEMLPATKSLK
jgi:hypothetical protein